MGLQRPQLLTAGGLAVAPQSRHVVRDEEVHRRGQPDAAARSSCPPLPARDHGGDVCGDSHGRGTSLSTPPSPAARRRRAGGGQQQACPPLLSAPARVPSTHPQPRAAPAPEAQAVPPTAVSALGQRPPFLVSVPPAASPPPGHGSLCGRLAGDPLRISAPPEPTSQTRGRVTSPSGPRTPSPCTPSLPHR